MAAGWHLVRVGGALLDPERSLAESSVVDGELIHLAPALAAPDGADLVDDLPAAVATAAVPHPGAPGPRGQPATCSTPSPPRSGWACR